VGPFSRSGNASIGLPTVRSASRTQGPRRYPCLAGYDCSAPALRSRGTGRMAAKYSLGGIGREPEPFEQGSFLAKYSGLLPFSEGDQFLAVAAGPMPGMTAAA
jgi:hypothetical protein